MNTKTHIVRSSIRLACDVQRVWEKVCFYEHIQIKPSLLLRTVLPVPERTTGAYRKVGDVSRCMYSDGGYLTKKITHLVSGERIEFDVIEQSIRYSTRIILKGGTIEVEAHEDGTTTVAMLTRYELTSPALSLIRYFIEHVISVMHRVVMKDMQEQLTFFARPNAPHLVHASLASDHSGR